MRRLAVALLLSGCGLTTQVRPTPRGTLAPQVAVGGPMADVGAPVPLPLSTVGAAYGFHERADVSAHVHVTTLAVSRVFGVDFGSAVLLVENDAAIPAVTLGLRGYLFSDFRSATQGFAESSLAVSWDLGRFRPFLACAVQLDGLARQYDLAPAVGTEVRFGKLTLTVDFKWYAPTRDTTVSSAPWVNPLGRGALGLVLGARYDVRLVE